MLLCDLQYALPALQSDEARPHELGVEALGEARLGSQHAAAIHHSGCAVGRPR